MDEVVPNWVEVVEVRVSRHCTKKTGLGGFCYTRVLRGSEVVECFVLRKLQLTAGELLMRKAVRDRVRWFDKKQ